MSLNYTLIRDSAVARGGLRREEEVDRLLEREARVAGKVSNSPPRVQSPSKGFGAGVRTLHTFASRRHKSGRSQKTKAGNAGEASLSWQATRKGSLRCEIFNLFSSFLVETLF